MRFRNAPRVDPDSVKFPCGGTGVSRGNPARTAEVRPRCSYCESVDSFDASGRCRNCGAEARQGQVVSVTPKPWRACLRQG